MGLQQFAINYGLKLIKLKNAWSYKKDMISRSSVQIPGNILIDYNSNRLMGYQRYLCNAPFTSLYFGVRGEVIACCKNRKKILGYVQNRSIEDIWNGKEAEELRTAIAQNDLSQGCEDCLSGILASNHNAILAQSYDTMQTDKKLDYPKRFDFELSNTCNLACIMCNGYLSSTYRKHFENLDPLPMVYDDQFVAQLETYIPHLKKTNFYGGEPFLIDIYFKIWEKILDINPSCTIFVQTNAHILNNKIKALLERGKFHLGISLESLKKEEFEKIRLYSNHDRFIQNINYFREYSKQKNTYFSFAITPLRHTVLELPDFVSFANSYDCTLFFNIITEPHDLSIWTLEPGVIQNYIDELSKIDLPQKTATEKFNVQQYQSYLNQMKRWKEEAIAREEYIKTFENLSLEKIQELLFEKAHHYIQTANVTDTEEINSFLSSLENKINTLHQKDPVESRKKLEFYCTLPDERFIHEFVTHVHA